MSQVCILTDNTAQFPKTSFDGHDLVNVIPLHIRLGEYISTDGKDLKLSGLPLSMRGSTCPEAIPPSVEEFTQIYTYLGRKYQEIITILISSHLSPTVEIAQQAALTARCSANIHIIDSQTTAVGQGLLVQAAAEAAAHGLPGARINRLVRGLIPRIYTVFCLQSLSYLAHSGLIDPAQAVVGELLGITPFFILENGRLVPIQKVRSPRHLVDLVQEFISEFSNLKHIALVQGIPPFEQEARTLRDRLNGTLSTTAFSEHTLSTALATIIGPRGLGIVVMENCSGDL